MASRISAQGSPARAFLKPASWVTVVALAAALSACGGGKDKPASQTAAKVNKEEITVHQINFVLAQQRGLKPEQAASASKVALERLIDQELEIQKATDQKLDRDPRVVQQLEAARRDIIARAYAEKIASGAPKPAPVEIKAYYDAHPALFANRRVYNLQEISIQAAPGQVADLQAKLAAAKTIPDFVSYLTANNFKYAANQAVRAAEQLPLATVDRFAQLQDGQSLFTRSPNGVDVVVVVASKTEPVDLEHATPAIEQFLWNERKRHVIEEDIHAMRTNAKIEYVGDYAKGGAREMSAPAAPASEAPLTSIAPPVAASAASVPSAAAPIEVEQVSTGASAAPTTGILEKGIKGFK